ncbi:hypothetical protein QOT17_020254 [Balamuthia mandrillaris]
MMSGCWVPGVVAALLLAILGGCLAVGVDVDPCRKARSCDSCVTISQRNHSVVCGWCGSAGDEGKCISCVNNTSPCPKPAECKSSWHCSNCPPDSAAWLFSVGAIIGFAAGGVVLGGLLTAAGVALCLCFCTRRKRRTIYVPDYHHTSTGYSRLQQFE